MLVWPIDSLGWIIANGQEAMTAADRIYEVLDVQPSIVDKPDAARGTYGFRGKRRHRSDRTGAAAGACGGTRR